MAVIDNDTEPIFQDREIYLEAVEHPDSVKNGGVFTVGLAMWQSVVLMGGSPTDPNYCWTIEGGTGRKVTVHAIVDDVHVTSTTFCVGARCNFDCHIPNYSVDVPVPDDLDVDTDAPVNLYFTTGDTGENQFRETFDGGPESTVATSVHVEPSENGGGVGPGDGGGGEWVEVEGSELVEVGDVIRVYHCVQAPDIPFQETIARVNLEASKLTGELNTELECIETEVTDTNVITNPNVVVDGDQCELMHVTTLKVTSIDDTCPDEKLRYSAIPAALFYAIAILIGAAGISLVLWRTEKLFSGESGDTVRLLSPVLLLGAGAVALGAMNDRDSN